MWMLTMNHEKGECEKSFVVVGFSWTHEGSTAESLITLCITGSTFSCVVEFIVKSLFIRCYFV